jgi:hypothetical protein
MCVCVCVRVCVCVCAGGCVCVSECLHMFADPLLSNTITLTL